MIVYLVHNRSNGKRYVGKTVRSLKQRWHEHCFNAGKDRDEMVLYSAIRKYGPDGFDVSILEEHSSVAALDAAEVRLIAGLGTHVSLGRGYNMTLGGDGLSGYKHTDRTKQKMSESRRGEKNHNYGRRFGISLNGMSEELKQRFSDERQGEGNPMFGRKQSDEAKAKIVAELKRRVRKVTPVFQLSQEGEVLHKYDSAQAASEAMVGRKSADCKILACCRGLLQTYHGFKWKHAEVGKG